MGALKLGAVLLAAGLLAGCAHRGYGRISAESFPTRDQLAKLESTPPLKKASADEVAPVAKWTLEGPLPTQLSEAPFDAATPVDKAVLQSQAGRAAQSRQSLACGAHELARIAVEYDKLPGQLLEEFIYARCAVTVARTQVRWTRGRVDASVTDDRLLEEWKDDFAKMFEKVPAGDRFGFSFVRGKGHAVFVLLHGPAWADFETAPLTPKSGKMLVKGRLRVPAVRFEADANRGVWDAVDCERVSDTHLPDFAFECPLSTDDVEARVDLWRLEEGRLLGESAATFLALPKGAAADTWVRPQPLDSKGGTAQERLVAAVNSLRARAGRKPVADAPAQSASAVRLLPHYLAAMSAGGDEAVVDQIALGMMAGWHVAEPKVGGKFGSANGDDGSEAGLAEALVLRPSGRRLLLDPEIERVASAMQPHRGGAYGIISSYRLHHGYSDPEDAASAFFNTLDAKRKAHGRPPSQWLRLPPTVEKTAHEALEKGADPYDVTHTLNQKVIDVAMRSVMGWVLQGDSYADIHLPDELLDAPVLDVVAVTGDSQFGGHPWVQPTVLAIIVTPPKQRTASAERGAASEPEL